jgi:plasmid maintenance system killer protein
MKIEPLRRDLTDYLRRRNLLKKFEKQSKLFSKNPSYPSLKTEILEPRSLKIYSFRIDKKYRAIFILLSSDKAEIVDINDHYK